MGEGKRRKSPKVWIKSLLGDRGGGFQEESKVQSCIKKLGGSASI